MVPVCKLHTEIGPKSCRFLKKSVIRLFGQITWHFRAFSSAVLCIQHLNRRGSESVWQTSISPEFTPASSFFTSYFHFFYFEGLSPVLLSSFLFCLSSCVGIRFTINNIYQCSVGNYIFNVLSWWMEKQSAGASVLDWAQKSGFRAKFATSSQNLNHHQIEWIIVSKVDELDKKKEKKMTHLDTVFL